MLGLRESITDSCAGLDLDAISAILGVDVIVEDASYGYVRFEPGYLSCSLKSQRTPDVSFAVVHVAPDASPGERTSAGNHRRMDSPDSHVAVRRW